MSGGLACGIAAHRSYWVVVQRQCNYSAFNGYHYTPSEYSLVRCTVPGCRSLWRTKATFVDDLPDEDSTTAERVEVEVNEGWQEPRTFLLPPPEKI